METEPIQLTYERNIEDTSIPQKYIDDPEIFVHEQETWDEKECAKRARYAPKDHWGNRPPKGIISNSGSVYCQYGDYVRWNGGITRDGKWYKAEYKPYPVIPDTYELYLLISWGKCIRKKEACSEQRDPIQQP